jgi:hypothetical protein
VTATLTHRCLRGRHCADHETTPGGGRLAAPTAAPDSLCATCERRVAHAIGELPRLYVDLAAISGEHHGAGEHVSGTPEPPTPPRLDVLVLQAEIDATVSTWAAPVAARCNVAWDAGRVRRLRPAPRVHRAAHLLAHRLDALLRLTATPVDVWTAGHGVTTVRGSGVDGALRLLRLHQHGRQLVTGGSGDARLPVPCPQCEAPALVRRNGADQVSCHGCGSSWPESDYRRLCLVLADDYRAERPRRRRRAV